MRISDLQDAAIKWSECFPHYNREKSYIKCEIASEEKDKYVGTFLVHIYYKGDYHFNCGFDKRGLYNITIKPSPLA